jgi:hypothetical protein
MWLLARLAPKALLEDRAKVAWLASKADPMVRLVDKLCGEKVAMRVEIDFEGGKNAAGGWRACWCAGGGVLNGTLGWLQVEHLRTLADCRLPLCCRLPTALHGGSGAALPPFARPLPPCLPQPAACAPCGYTAPHLATGGYSAALPSPDTPPPPPRPRPVCAQEAFGVNGPLRGGLCARRAQRRDLPGRVVPGGARGAGGQAGLHGVCGTGLLQVGVGGGLLGPAGGCCCCYVCVWGGGCFVVACLPAAACTY